MPYTVTKVFISWVLQAVLFVILSGHASGQTHRDGYPNFGLNGKDASGEVPEKIILWGGHRVKADTLTKVEGNQSLLLELPQKDHPGDFVGFAIKIPAMYIGNQISLSGSLKTQQVKDGNATLILRVDDINGVANFLDMGNEQLQGTTDWKTFHISTAIPKDAKNILVGAMLTGLGKMWVDQLNVEIDGKKIDDSTLVVKKTYRADEDTAFNTRSGIYINNISEQQLQYISLFCKIWGLVKYYHPAVARGDINMDAEFFRLLPSVLQMNTQASFNQLLYKWITTISPDTFPIITEYPKKTYQKTNDTRWMNSPLLGKELSAFLKRLVQTAQLDDHYYVMSAPGIGNAHFTNERVYHNNKTDQGYRLLGLCRYWNAIQYFFPYKELTGKDWSNMLDEWIRPFVFAPDEWAYKLSYLKIMASIHDGHSQLANYDEEVDRYYGARSVPVQLAFIQGKFVVTDVTDAINNPDRIIRKGDIILTVNGQSIRKKMEVLRNTMPGSNARAVNVNIARHLLRTNDSVLDVSVSRNGQLFTCRLKTKDPSERLANLINKMKKPAIDELKDNIIYIDVGRVTKEDIERNIRLIMGSKGLILDYRKYPTVDLHEILSNDLFTKVHPFAIFEIPDYTFPGNFYYGPPVVIGKNSISSYRNKIIILVDEHTQSAGEFQVMAFSVREKTTIIGSTTAGTDGNVSTIRLPGGWKVGFSGLGVVYPDGKPTQRIGIQPDVTVYPTLSGIRNGKDEILEKALSIIRRN